MIGVLFKQKTAYEMSISDWSSDECSSDLSHEDELSQTGYDSRNAAAGKRPPIFLLDRQHRTAIPLAGSILSALSQSAAAQQSGCSGGTGHKGTAKQKGSPQRHQSLEKTARRRSEERRVVQEWVRTCRSRWWRYH